MKRVFLALALLVSIGIASCEKGEVAQQTQQDCHCGEITNDGIDNGCYWLQIRNDCSDNYKTFCFAYSDWLTGYVGTDFCVLNETW